MKKQCFLILIHKEIDEYRSFFLENKDKNFYIHVDLKSDFFRISQGFKDVNNIFFIDNRIDIKWAGFSMVQATINLIDFALNHDKENEYFHLVSGDDVVLAKSTMWEDDSIYMECRVSTAHQYRMRFNTPHADTLYQRTFVGKALTQFYKTLAKLLPTHEKYYFGSQWFSIRRQQLLQMMSSITREDIEFFRKKLCPDEHFFQYLIIKNMLLNQISTSGNKRFIIFDQFYQRGSSPIFLDLDQLIEAKSKNYWFARKVERNTMSKFYELNK